MFAVPSMPSAAPPRVSTADSSQKHAIPREFSLKGAKSLNLRGVGRAKAPLTCICEECAPDSEQSLEESFAEPLRSDCSRYIVEPS